MVLGGQVGDQLRERLHLSLVDEVELSDEIVEVLEASVEMRFLTKRDNAVEVAVVDVGVDSEKTLEDRLDDSLESLGEGNVGVGREDVLIIQLRLNPGHEVLNILRSGALDGFLDLLTIHPEVLIPLTYANTAESMVRIVDGKAI